MFKILITFFFIIVCGVRGLYSQESFKSIQPIEYTIRVENYTSASNEKQLLTSLSINNIKNIHQLRLYFKADLLLNVQQDEDGHLFAYIKAVNPRLSGDIYFRDFLVDTLLTPLIFDGKLFVAAKGRHLHEMPIEMLLTGGVLDLEILERYKLKTDDFSFKVEVEKLMFSDQQVIDFMNKANLINSYYSYNEVIELLLERYHGNKISRGNSSAETFIAWNHIHRVTSFIETYDFTSKLNLDKNDPKEFRKKKDQIARLEERASTIFTKELEKGKRGKLLERNEYCRKYVDISNDYIKLSKNYQPNTVSAFNELVRIFPVEEDLNRMFGVAAFYDVFKITNVPSTFQLIYNNFVSSADSTLKRQEYLNTLNLVRNAMEMETFFMNVKRSKKFSEVYSEALNGLMSSFLKVSVMAYKSRNFIIAKRYYLQAQQIYNENADFVGDDFMVKHSFQEFVQKQVNLAGMMLDDNYFEDAIELLDQAKSISEENDFELSEFDFNAAYKKGYTGIYNILVDSIEYYIQQQNKNNTLSTLLNSVAFEQSHIDYLKRDERVSSYAIILFDHYMNAGLLKLKSNKPEDALNYLFEARKLNEIFQLSHTDQIDSAFTEAIVPVIMQLINKAEFEVWAKRLEEAYLLKDEAVSLSVKYGLSDAAQVKQALLKLEEKISNRVCIDIQYKVNNACKVSVNRIQVGKIEEGKIVLKKTDDLINTHPECRVEKSVFDSLLAVYQPLFKYIEEADSLYKILGYANFSDIKKLSDVIRNKYNTHGLKRYLDEIPSLIDLMREKGSVPEYFEAIQYYINQQEFLTAFYYLDLLKLNEVFARDTRLYQKEIGYEICKGQVEKESYLNELINNDPWYKVLKTSCLKN